MEGDADAEDTLHADTDVNGEDIWDGEEEEWPEAPLACPARVDIDSTAGVPDGLSWETAFRNVQDGIVAAGGECEVWVAEGTYYIYESEQEDTLLLVAGSQLYGGFEGMETLRSERDWLAHPTILDGHDGPEEAAQVFHVMTAADDVLVDGFTITGGNANGSGDHDTGGGLFLDRVSGVTVSNCNFIMNSAEFGGAITALYCPVTVRNCLFMDNKAIPHSGGAIHMHQPEITPGSRATILNCTFVVPSVNVTP